LDAWISVLTAWDGTTPLGDFGSFTTAIGLLAGNASAVDMTQVDTPYPESTGLSTSSVGTSLSTALITENNGGAFGPVPTWQATFVAATPIKVCVSSTGHPGGADPGATQGAAVLYLVTATPV
jgi:hypothetical protein